MNLDLPHALRAPLAAAASVAVLAVGAVIVTQSVGSDEDALVASPPTSRTPRPSPTNTVPATRPLPLPPLNSNAANQDLDRCALVAQNSPKAGEFPPRQTWRPVFTVDVNGHRITAFRADVLPMFCDTTATTATVSDPGAGPMLMKPAGIDNEDKADFSGLYLSPAGVLGGAIRGAARLECDVNTLIESGSGGSSFRTRTETASVLDGLFVVYVGALKDGDEILSTAFDANGRPVIGGGMRFERSRVRPSLTG